MTASRRTFFLQTLSGVAALSALTLSERVNAQTMVAEDEPDALALGYKADATKADTKKFPSYAAGQSCSGCVLFQGKAGDSAAVCPAFGNKKVNSKGWCSAWVKKA
jgi:hypothetical protein